MPDWSSETVERAGLRALALDIFRPQRAGHGIAVVLLHGGAWRMGHRSMMHPYAALLAASGYVAVCAEYRLVGEAPWPAQLDDVMACLDWIAENAARLGVRPDRIVVEGFSAGGHLALMAGVHRKTVAAVVAFFAPPSMVHASPRPAPAPKEMLLAPDADGNTVDNASPIRQVKAGFPPTFLLAGVDDPMVTPSDMIAMFETLRTHGVTTELHLYSGHTHEFSVLPSMLAPVQAEIDLFLRRNVVDPVYYVKENVELNMFAAPGGPRMRPPGA
jgi:acetyl esterase/lipase